MTNWKNKYLKYKFKYHKFKQKAGMLLPPHPIYWADEVPIEFIRIDDNCEKSKKWEKVAVLNEGSIGITYHICKDHNDCEYVLKSQDISTEKNYVEFINEVTILNKIQHWRAAPTIYDAWICQDKGYFVMELLYPLNIPNDKIWETAASLLDEFHEMGYIHGDLHEGNILCNKHGNMIFIDYGSSIYFPSPFHILRDERIYVEIKKIKKEPGKRFEYIYPMNMYELCIIDRWKISTLDGAPVTEYEISIEEKNKMQKGLYSNYIGVIPPKLTRNNINYIPQSINENITREKLLEKERNNILKAEQAVLDKTKKFRKFNKKETSLNK